MSEAARTVLERWEISADELTQIIDQNPSLRGMLLGYAAESKLRTTWFSGKAVEGVVKSDDHDRTKKGDLVVRYKGKDFTVECKSVQTNTIRREGETWTARAQVDASDARRVSLPDGSGVVTTCLVTGEFDLLAVSLFAFEEKWRFVFAKNTDLPRTVSKKYKRKQRQYLLQTLVKVSWPPDLPFREEPFSLLDEML